MNKEIIKKFYNNIKGDHISESVAQCSYYTVLSFIPFAILLITLIQYTGIDAQTVFDIILKVVPENMSEVILNIVQEVYSKSLGTISISAIVTIWSAGKGLFALNKGLQAVYHTGDQKEPSYFYLRGKAILETIIFIVLIVAGMVAMVFGSSLLSMIKEHFGIFENFKGLSSILTKIGIYFITFIIFIVIYKFIPKHKVTFKSQFCGALFGSIALNVISYIFSQYLNIFKGFSLTYGSLTTLMLIMMWTYACFYTVLLGAEINKIKLAKL